MAHRKSETRPAVALPDAAALPLHRLLDDAAARPDLANLARIHRLVMSRRMEVAPVVRRVACAASFTFEPLLPALNIQALRAGAPIDTIVAPFGQWEQELIDPRSRMARFEPDAVLLALRMQDACPEIYVGFNALSSAEVERRLDDWHVRLSSALRTFRVRCPAPILIQNHQLPAVLALGPADSGAVVSQRAAIEGANRRLAELSNDVGGVYVLDYDGLVARHGRARWSDARLEYYARIPIAPANYWHLAGFYVRHLRPLWGLSRKVLVLDADHTLWGGVVGDVGPEGIELGNDYPGNAFVAFQHRVLDLYHRGVILGLVSKNEPGPVMDVLTRHPRMILRPEHFADMRINWEPKPDNLAAMAHHLSLGLDSFVFVDDSPVECELVRQALPQVMTVPLPAEPAAMPAVIEALDCFDQWSLSEEDRSRGRMYRAEADRRELQATVVDMPTFLRRLEMKAVVSIDDPAQIVRSAQMTNRTNQFNMNTIRCTEDDMRRFVSAADWHVYTLALGDRFGDHGVVGLAVVGCHPEEWTQHLFMMSCRVLGRGVEQGFVAFVAEQAARQGVRRLVGEFAPTPKNAPFARFYASCGFTAPSASRKVTETGQRASPGSTISPERWLLPLPAADLRIPDHVELTIGSSETRRDESRQ